MVLSDPPQARSARRRTRFPTARISCEGEHEDEDENDDKPELRGRPKSLPSLPLVEHLGETAMEFGENVLLIECRYNNRHEILMAHRFTFRHVRPQKSM